MSFIALNTAITGLRTAQQQLSAISNNIANATTEGYTRKILPTSSKVIDSTGEGYGVKSDPLVRKVDMNLQRELWTQVSGVGELSVKASYLDTIEKFHGATNKQASIAAQIAELKDKFAGLSDSPSDSFLLQSAVSQASEVASKFNDFGTLLTRLRNDAQDEMATTIGRVNDLLKQIADMNGSIRGTANLNRSVAGLEDTRDKAIKELSGLIGITTFTRGDGVIVVQSASGAQLADERPTNIFFKPGAIGVANSYPNDVAGVFVGGDPRTNKAAVDLAATNVGGKLGGLIDLRDNTLVQYQAQADEAAHKLALRLDSQGLRLFTDQTGGIPADTPPNLSTNPPTPVAYVGFASTIRVNQAVLDDVTLIQKGTYTSDAPLPTGSNEVIRRVIQFGFGNISHQEINGTTNLNDASPATDLQTWLGLKSSNNVIGGLNLAAFSQIDDGAAGGTDLREKLQDYLLSYPANDQFQITLAEDRLGGSPVTITIDLSDAQTNNPIGGAVTNALDQIIAEINDQIAAATLPTGLTASATRNANGQLVIKSSGDVTLSASGFSGGMGAEAFKALGFQEKTHKTEDPYFDIQVGTGTVQRITIEPGEDVNDLIDKLEYDPVTGKGVAGLSVQFDTGTGRLSLRPGMDSTNGGPKFGGDIKIIGGPAKTSGAVNAALSALPQPVSIVAALFGNYSVSGGTVSESSPVTNVEYKSETAQGSGVFVPFRIANLGSSGRTSTELNGNTVIDFANKMINAQAQDIVLNTSKAADETSLRDLIQQRFLDETGVNIDEELSSLIVIQTAYSAAARAVNAAEEMFQTLLDSVR